MAGVEFEHIWQDLTIAREQEREAAAQYRDAPSRYSRALWFDALRAFDRIAANYVEASMALAK